MTQEDKQLLLVDLCGRLPYGVVVHICSRGKNAVRDVILSEDNITNAFRVPEGWWKEIKPYLRPMPSMTEKEKGHVKDIIDEFADRWLDSDVAKDKWDATFWQCSEIVNYLNSIHIDYRGLIEKCLALEAPEGMYVKEEQQ